MARQANNATLVDSTTHNRTRPENPVRRHHLVVSTGAAPESMHVGVVVKGSGVYVHVWTIDEYFPGSGSFRMNARTVSRLKRLAEEKSMGVIDARFANRLRRQIRNQASRYKRSRRPH